MICSVCEDCGWVCETHPDRPFQGERACTCGGGAGEPCRFCNASDEDTQPRMLNDFRIEFDKRGWRH